MTSVDGSPGRPRRRRVLWGVLGVLVVLVVVGLWMGLGAKRAASVIQTQASAAQTSIETAKTKLEAGDYAGAHAAAAQADAQVAEAADAAGSAPVRALGHLPVAGQAVADLDRSRRYRARCPARTHWRRRATASLPSSTRCSRR